MTFPPILVADTRHFSQRRFPPLYGFAAKNNVPIWAEKSRSAWWERVDGYRRFADRLAPHRRSLQGLSLAQLKAHRYRGIGVLACASDEMLCLLSRRRQAGPAPESNAAAIAQALAAADGREELLLCMAATQDWVDFWHRLLDRKGPFLCAVVDRGRAIHSRTLLEVASVRGIRTFVTDRFPIGRHLFFEERSPSGAHLSALADPDWCRRLVLPSDLAERERVRAEAHRRLAPIRAAVAARPASEELAAACNPPAGDMALVLGGSPEEPSLLDPPLAEAAPPTLCRRLIAGILDHTDLRAVFHAGVPLATRLGAWRDALPASEQGRFRLAGTARLEILLSQAKLVVSLSAPLTFAACRAGLKPVQFGRTVLAGRGFTHDFAGPDEFRDKLAAGPLDGVLSLGEYRRFEDFLARLVLLHLVPEGDEGVRKIAARLAEPGHVPTLRECDFGAAPPASRWSTLAKAVANPTAARRLAATWSDPD
jgi:hypothetical protein